MSKGIYSWHPSIAHRRTKTKPPPDPRVAIAMHIGWRKISGEETEWATPEPDNYNRALMSDRCISCDLATHSIFYWDPYRSRWWSVYLVPDNNAMDYDLWVMRQQYELRWRHAHAPAQRQRHQFLKYRQGQAEMTANERLYTMGYYDELKSKYFADCTTMVDQRTGLARADLAGWEFTEQVYPA